MSLEDLAIFLNSREPKGKLVEIGVGFNFKVALKLKELGRDIIVVDWNLEAIEKAKELGLKAYVDNIFTPNLALYKDASVIYSIRPTPEIIKPILELGKRVKVPVYIVPFSLDVMPKSLKLENYKGIPIYSWAPYQKDI